MRFSAGFLALKHGKRALKMHAARAFQQHGISRPQIVFEPSPRGFGVWQEQRGNTAGARSFGLDRQQNGLWQDLPSTEAQSITRITNTPVTSAESNDSFTLSALTPKGMALTKGARLAAPYASHSGNGSGMGAGARPFAAQRGVGSAKSQYGFKTGGFGNLGNGSGSQPANLGTPSSGTVNSPAIDDTFPLDEGLGSEKPLGSDELDSTGGASH